MAHDTTRETLLGRVTGPVTGYSPQILHPLPRSVGRDELGLKADLPMYGVDQWHAYEMSWLNGQGMPLAYVGRFVVPCASDNIVESKSFKLYLNSLNNHCFDTPDVARQVIIEDLGKIVGAEVELELWPVDSALPCSQSLPGKCLDDLVCEVPTAAPHAAMIKVDESVRTKEALHSHLLRSLCPVTGQPDWASVLVHCCGHTIDHTSLLQYLLAYRHHREFHEQCVERMFNDLYNRCQPKFLLVQAFYTRRGGIDINPFRCTDPEADPLPRLGRQ